MDDIIIIWTEFAAKELDNIFDYILNESKSFETAAKLVDIIFARTEQLRQMPLSGQEETYLKDFSVRYIVVGNYKIHYKYYDDKIIITDVFHTKRNPDNMKNQE